MAKARKSGWYRFADGYECWSNGFSSQELKWEVYKHGKMIQFIPD